MNEEQMKEKLESYGQERLVQAFDTWDEKEKAQFLNQMECIDMGLLDSIHQGGTEETKGKLEPLAGISITQIQENKQKYDELGMRAILGGKVGAVLLAGGQGTRLGFDKPKGMFNIGVDTEKYIFQCLIENLMDVTKRCGVFVPLYIMTSEKNHEDTTGFFAAHDYFGYPQEYISFFKQDMAPSVDFNGKLLLEARGKLVLSPNGNGGWFSSMARAGLLEDVKRRGIEWLNVFAVDNVLQRIADPCFVGATIDSGCVSGAKVVRKAEPQERVGVLCLEDGRPSIVEYYEMTDDMIHLRDEEGNLAYAFGVILNYLFRVDKLEQIRDNRMPVHVVEKKIPYMDEDGSSVSPEEPNGYKFEELILDMIHLLDNCLPYEVDREREFAPVKNKSGVDSVDSARRLLRKNGVKL